MQNNQEEPRKSVNAEEFIGKHNLEPVLAEMLNTLVYEKVRNPEIFMIKYLSSLLTNEERIKHGIHVPDNSLPNSKKIVKFPTQLSNEAVKKHLTKKVWEEIKHKTTKHGATVNDLLKEGDSGLTLPDPDSLNVFNDLVTGVINTNHEVSHPLRKVERYNENPNKCIECSWNNLLFYKLEYYRNLPNYPFVTKCKSSHLEEISAKIDTAVNSLDNSSFDLKCVKFTENPFEYSEILNINRVFIWTTPTIYSTLYHSTGNDDDIKIILLVNDNSHLRIVVNANKSKMSQAYERLSTIHKVLDEKLNFEFDSSYGFLNSDIMKLGNTLSFYGEFAIDKLFDNKTELFEEIKKTFDISVLEVNESDSNSGSHKLVKINMTQTLKESENEFLENVFQKLYNLDYLNTNYNKDDRVENISDKFEDEVEKTESLQEKNFFTGVNRAYNSSYALHQFSHFHPNSITINSIIEDILLNVNNIFYFDLFPQFYSTFMISYRSLCDEILQKKVLDQTTRNLQDFRDSLTNFDMYSFSAIRNFNIKIRRNISDFNFSHYLSDQERDNLLTILNERINETFSNEGFEYESSTKSYHSREKQVTLHLNKGDHIIFELNSHPRNNDLVKLIEFFFSTYQKLTANLELNKITYLSRPNLGYLTNDLRYLGTGLTFKTEVDVCDKLDYALQSYLLKDGFYIEQGTLYENGIISFVLGCNLNTNTGVYRIFNVLVDMFKSLKISNSFEKIKDTLEVTEEII